MTIRVPLLGAFLVLACLSASAAPDAADSAPWETSLSRASELIRESRAKAAATAAPEVKRADLSWQFPDEPNRDQGDVGSCHAFASVALLEAAVFRAHARHVRFSEADMFVQQSILNGNVFDTECWRGKCALSEGGWAETDAEWAVEHGLLSDPSYADFAKRYAEFRSSQQELLSGLPANRLERWLLNPMARSKEWMESPEAQKIAVRQLLKRDDGPAAKERAAAKALLEGLRVETKGFKRLWRWDPTRLTPEQCRNVSAEQRSVLLAELDAGRPVGVSMALFGLPDWSGPAGSRDDQHVFVVTGYDRLDDRVTFHSRNSWGGLNPDVDDGFLCRVNQLVSVAGPGEHPAFEADAAR